MPWSSLADDFFLEYDLILGTPEADGSWADMSGKGSSYVAKGVAYCEVLVEGGPGSELPEPPRLCSLAWPPVVDGLDGWPPPNGLDDEYVDRGVIIDSFLKFCREVDRREASGEDGEAAALLSSSLDRLECERKLRVERVSLAGIEEATAAGLLRPALRWDDMMAMTGREVNAVHAERRHGRGGSAEESGRQLSLGARPQLASASTAMKTAEGYRLVLCRCEGMLRMVGRGDGDGRPATLEADYLAGDEECCNGVNKMGESWL